MSALELEPELNVLRAAQAPSALVVGRAYSALGSGPALEHESRSVTVAGHGHRARLVMAGNLVASAAASVASERVICGRAPAR